MTSLWPDPSPGGYYNWMLDQNAKGMEYLGGAEATASVAQLGPVAFRPRDILFIMVRVSGMSAAALPCLQLNGDTGPNYWDRNLQAAAGSNLWTETTSQAATPGMLRLGSTAATGGRLGLVVVMNRQASTKNLVGELATATGSAATVGALQVFSGEWVNTTSQVQSLTLLTSNTATYNADSGFGVFGKDFP